VSKEDESDEDEIIFPQLNSLNFVRLENLRRFYRGNLSFPSLQEFSVKDCYQLITLCTGTVEVHKLSRVTIDFEENIPLKSDINSIMRKTFLSEVRV